MIPTPTFSERSSSLSIRENQGIRTAETGEVRGIDASLCGAETSRFASGRTGRARTDIAQEVPGVVAIAVPIIPVKAQSVLSHRFSLHRPHVCAHRPQVLEAHWARSARLPALSGAASRTPRAGTDRAQVGEAVMTAMSVLPFDVHTRARCQLYLDRIRLGAARHSWDCNACKEALFLYPFPAKSA